MLTFYFCYWRIYFNFTLTLATIFLYFLINIYIFHLVKAEIDLAVKELLSLKATFKATTGSEWNPNTTTENKPTLVAPVKKDLPAKKLEKVHKITMD